MCQWVEYINSLEKTTPFSSKEEEEKAIIIIKDSLNIYSNLKNKDVILNKFKEGNNYRDFLKKAENKLILTADVKLKVSNAIISMKNHTIIKELFYNFNKNVYKEKTIIFNVIYTYKGKEKLIKCKSKIDWFSVDINNKIIILRDIKTGSFTIGEYKYKFKSRHTYRQLAFYFEAICNFIYKEFNVQIDNTWLVNFEIVAVSLLEDFKCSIFKIDNNWIDKGKEELKELFIQYITNEEYGYDYFAEEYINNYKLNLNFEE